MPLAESLSYDHQCSAPPTGHRRWFCPDCGTLWIYIRKMVGRQTVADWRPVSRGSEPEAFRLRRQLVAVRQAHDWQCDCTPADPCRTRTALEEP